MTLFLTYSSSLTCSAAQPPHRLSSVDDPYALTLSASPSPRHSTGELPLSPSPRGSYVPVDNPAAPLRPAMSYNNERGYSNMDAPYSNQAFSSSAWLEKEQARNKRSKWIVSRPPFILTIPRLGYPLVGECLGMSVVVAAAAAPPPCPPSRSGRRALHTGKPPILVQS